MTREEMLDRLNKGRDPLLLSIRKWKDIYRWLCSLRSQRISDRHMRTFKGLSYGHRNCALCQIYLDHECVRCPVSMHVDAPYCHSTPYDNWTATAMRGAHVTKLRVLALEELNFLRSLLP